MGTYNDYVPAFEEMFKQNDSSFEKFYAVAREVSKLPAEERTQIMQDLLNNKSDNSSSVASQ